ncbi:MAG TPA: TetR/AcrR family transcriptional regulator [Gammaproteobacteria bacterium]|nr:TetR/AcrR family transcriptional regulator [Gammaproteobacteria bacterium]
MQRKSVRGRTSYHHGDLRRVILDTAQAMLTEDQNWQFTLREVARRAGVSHAAPYKHFPDKASLLAELAMLGFDRLREALTVAVEAHPRSVRKALLLGATAYVKFGTEHPALYRLMFSATAERAAGVHTSERALSALGVLLELLQRGQREGVFRRRAVQGQAAACWAQVHGLTLLAIDGLLLPEKIGDAAVDAALATLLEGLEIP